MKTVLSACVALILAGPLSDIYADSGPSREFAIEAQPLDAALKAFAFQSQREIFFTADLTRGKLTHGVSGAHADLEALDELLTDTGLTYSITASKAILVRDAAVPPTAGDGRSGGEQGLSAAPSKGVLRLNQAERAATSASRTEEGSAPAPRAEEFRGKLEEVIVTAQKREEKLQDVPVAITAMSEAELQTKGITTLAGVTAATPSITMERFGSSRDTLLVFMRGQGSINPRNANVEGAVGFYQDGFFLARATGLTVDLADVERVEVLRGPQGTLYGMNTTGGAVNIISKKPTGEFGIKQTLDFGNRNLFRSLTAVNLPQWGDLAAKVTVINSSIDGYVKNPGASHDFGEESQRAARLQLRWKPTGSFTADYFADVGRFNWTPSYFQNPFLDGITINGLTYVAPNRPLDTAYRPVNVPLNKDKMQGQGLTLSWDLNDSLTLKSLTGYHKLSAPGFSDLADAPGFPVSVNLVVESREFSQEFQVLGKFLDDQFRYVAGLYYFDGRSSENNVYDFSAFGFTEEARPQYKAKSKAVYGQLTWVPEALERRLELTLGGRYTKDDRSGVNYDAIFVGGTPVNVQTQTPTLNFHSFNPAFILNYRWTDDLRSYAKATTGYKAGGVAFTVPGFNDTFKPEKITTYEVGLKSDWLDQRLRLNADVFYSNYRDLQQIIPTGVAFQSANYNVGRATIQGLELELLARPIEDLALSLNYSHLDPKFDEVPVIANTFYDQGVNPGSSYNPGDNIARLFTLPFAAKNSVAAGIDYTVLSFAHGGLDAHVDYRWQSKYYIRSTLGPAVINRDYGAVDAYGIVNARLTLSSTLSNGALVTVGLWGHNLTDKRYKQGTITADDGAIPATVLRAYSAWSEPRAYGISLGYDF